ncbi:hypothetical protein ACWDR0_02005 [Streptomyces sp. NPDC003691]
MAEQHDADREPQPIDEEAAWAAIVAGYGDEPPDPPGAKPFKSVEDLAALEGQINRKPVPGPGRNTADEPDPPAAEDSGADGGEAAGPGDVPRLGSSVTFAPGVGGAGPRDYSVAEAKEDDLDESDEGHFVPPEPPPLPEADVTAKFAWLAVVGGPVLMLIAVLLQWDMTWWLTTLSVGGFLGGFATLVARMADGDDEEDEDPGRGAVV